MIKLNKLRLKNLTEIRTRRGVAFSATLDLNGQPVIIVENDGRGGCNAYTHVTLPNREFRPILKNLEDQAARLCGTVEALDHIIALRNEGQYL